MQLGGRFMSFDVAEAHIGLGDVEALDSVTVHWADGGETTIDGPLPAGARYLIERRGGTLN
ncbi:ASPIC/UnbV domain-containing protein [Breoghania sp.]|uniref:ASPIC/UnbV domain-containing protein n=1 Tax=Breoghania sp. TaxID=2065378 RepID=UPI0026254DE0|nr:ASPIC/UnbV domain-containing protein [Breoghania sp.]MDJ0933186.1 ASPIC/UnbV domain-containing protein [Breoghania sp.]